MSLTLGAASAPALPTPADHAAAERALRLQALLARERGRLAPWLAVALGGGVLGYFALGTEPPGVWRWAAPPLLLAATLLARRAPLLAWLVGLLAAAALGFAMASWHTARQPPLLDPPRGAVVLSGRVADVTLLPEGGRRVTVAAPSLDGGAPLPRTLRVRLRGDDPTQPAPGDTLSVRALVRPPAPPAYPGAWDFQRASFFTGLGGSGFAIGRSTLTPGDQAASFAALRAAIEQRTAAAIPGGSGAIAAALLTGSQGAIPAADVSALRDSGLAHLLSPSGLHVAIVMGVTFGVVRLLLAAVPWVALRWPIKAIAALAALGAGAGYLALTGFVVPMQRSFAMAALATLAMLAGRRALTLRAWALAAAVVLLLQPASVLGASFQMSFAAVLALIAGWEWLRPRLDAAAGPRGWGRRARLFLFGLVGTSILAGLATTPFGLHHFGRLQLYGVAANALAVPLTSVLVMPAGMLAAVLMPLGLEGLALTLMGWGVDGILAIARTVAAWPGAALAARPIPAWGLGLCAAGLLMLCLPRGRWRLAGVPLFLAGLLSGAAVRPPDLLISADARLIAVRTEAGVAVQRLTGASAPVRQSWARLLGAEGVPWPARGAALDGTLDCVPEGCRFRPAPDAPEVALLRAGGAEAACATAALVVSAEPVRGRCAAQVIDRFSVWRAGAHAVWLDPAGPRVLSDRAWRGARPWVPPVPVPRGRASPEPPAITE